MKSLTHCRVLAHFWDYLSTWDYLRPIWDSNPENLNPLLKKLLWTTFGMTAMVCSSLIGMIESTISLKYMLLNSSSAISFDSIRRFVLVASLVVILLPLRSLTICTVFVKLSPDVRVAKRGRRVIFCKVSSPDISLSDACFSKCESCVGERDIDTRSDPINFILFA